MDNNKDFSNIIIYTSILYGSDEASVVRSKLCLRLLKNAHDLGVRVVVKDGGSSESFLKSASSFDNVTIIKNDAGASGKSMGQDRRLALNTAIQIAEEEKNETPRFLWTEPEKDELISINNLNKMSEEISRGANIVVPARKENAWESLPKIQRWFERRANKRAHEVIGEVYGVKRGEQLDLWFGPKMFDKSGAKFFAEYNKDGTRADLWDATIVPVAEAVKEGKNVVSVPVDYEYSEAQRASESGELNKIFNLKRLEQYAQILREFGDKTWLDFFERNKQELSELKIVESDLKNNPNGAELVGQKNELKRELIKSFFKLK